MSGTRMVRDFGFETAFRHLNTRAANPAGVLPTIWLTPPCSHVPALPAFCYTPLASEHFRDISHCYLRLCTLSLILHLHPLTRSAAAATHQPSSLCFCFCFCFCFPLLLFFLFFKPKQIAPHEPNFEGPSTMLLWLSADLLALALHSPECFGSAQIDCHHEPLRHICVCRKRPCLSLT